ncbi:MAG: hypothetical protein WCL08_08985, partial [Verrucomicrobiota bacterium]
KILSRDMVKFGILILNKVQLNGRPFIPEAYLARATTAFTKQARGDGYGFFWWTQDFTVGVKVSVPTGVGVKVSVPTGATGAPPRALHRPQSRRCVARDAGDRDTPPLGAERTTGAAGWLSQLIPFSLWQDPSPATRAKPRRGD